MAASWHTSHADADPILATPLADPSAPTSSRRAGRDVCDRRDRLLEPGRDTWGRPSRPARAGGRPGRNDPHRLGFDGADGSPIKLPQGETTWISAGRAAVLAATLASGKTSTSDPVHLGKPLAWRPVKATVPTGETPAGPDYFATWDPEGGRSRRSRAICCPATGSGSCSSTPRPRPPSRWRSIDPSWPRRRSGSTAIASRSSPVMRPRRRGDRGHDDRRDRRRTGRGAAPGDLGDRAADRHDGGPGCADRDPRHRRLACRRRIADRLDRAAGRIHDCDRIRPRLERSAASGGLGQPRTAR